MVWSSSAPASAKNVDDALTATAVSEHERASALLQSPTASRESRTQAARFLLGSADPRARTELTDVLTIHPEELGISQPDSGDQPPSETRTIVLQAIAQCDDVGDWMTQHLLVLARTPLAADRTLEQQLAAVEALGSVRTRIAARELVTLACGQASPAQISAGAYAALTRLSGHEEFGNDCRLWSQWLMQVEVLSDAQWHQTLTTAIAAQARAAMLERDAASRRLVDRFSDELQDAQTIEERSLLIESAMRDELTPMRRAGFTAALQDLANSRPLEPRVGQAAMDILASSIAESRRDAAELLNVLAPSSFAQRASDALKRETDSRVAALLLKSQARWPSPDLRATVLRWMEFGEPTRTPAIEAADALYDRGWLFDQADREKALRVLSNADADALPPAGVRLLFALGDQEQKTRVSTMLRTGTSDRRRVIAEVLARQPDALPVILDAARADGALFDAALKALTAHWQTADSYRLALSLPTDDPDLRRALLLQLAAKLSPDDLLAAAVQETDLENREAMLARLVSEPLRWTSGTMPGLASATQPAGVRDGLLLLTQTRLELGRPSAALIALDALAPASVLTDTLQRDALRLEALLWLGRIDEAAQLSCGPGEWLAGLDRCTDLAHAPRVLATIRERFGTAMSPDQIMRLAILRDRTASFVGPPSRVERD